MSCNNCMSFGTVNQSRQLNILINESIAKKFTIVKILQEVQKIYGFLPENVLTYVATKINKPISELYSVATFYAEFSFSPKGEFPISVCLGTACYVNGAQDIFNKICQLLNIKEGECTPDKKFSIDQTRCIGCCGMAPVLTIGQDVYGNVKLADIEKILSKYMG